MLQLSRPNSPDLRLTGDKSFMVIAPEAGGWWDARSVRKSPGSLDFGNVGILPYSGAFRVRAPYDHVGDGQADVVWTKGARQEVVTIYFGDGPKSVTDNQEPRWMTVSFTGRVRAKARFFLNYYHYQLALHETTTSLLGMGARMCRLDPEEFEEKFAPIAVEGKSGALAGVVR